MPKLGQRIRRYNGYRAVHDGNSDCSADVLAVTFVFWVNFDGDACRYELGTGSGNQQVFVAAFKLEANVVQDRFFFDVVDFCVGDGGFVVGHQFTG